MHVTVESPPTEGGSGRKVINPKCPKKRVLKHFIFSGGGPIILSLKGYLQEDFVKVPLNIVTVCLSHSSGESRVQMDKHKRINCH